MVPFLIECTRIIPQLLAEQCRPIVIIPKVFSTNGRPQTVPIYECCPVILQFYIPITAWFFCFKDLFNLLNFNFKNNYLYLFGIQQHALSPGLLQQSVSSRAVWLLSPVLHPSTSAGDPPLRSMHVLGPGQSASLLQSPWHIVNELGSPPIHSRFGP